MTSASPAAASPLRVSMSSKRSVTAGVSGRSPCTQAWKMKVSLGQGEYARRSGATILVFLGSLGAGCGQGQ